MTVRLNDEEIKTYFYEIATGRRNVCIEKTNNENLFISIRQPTTEEKILGQWVYDQEFNRAVNVSRIKTISQMKRDFIEENTSYNQKEMSLISDFDSRILVLRLNLKKPMDEIIKLEQNQKLKNIEDRLFYIKYKKETKFLQNTAEALANSKRNRHYTFVCTEKFACPGQSFWNSKEEFQNSNIVLILKIIREISSFHVGMEHGILRAIVKDNTVRTMWRASVKTGAPFFGIPMQGGSNVFSNPASRWTPDQVNLVGWLMYYQNIEESSEPPPKHILEDDELLDKYVNSLIRKKELERVKSANKTGSNNTGSGKNVITDKIIMDPDLKEQIWGGQK